MNTVHNNLRLSSVDLSITTAKLHKTIGDAVTCLTYLQPGSIVCRSLSFYAILGLYVFLLLSCEI